MTISLKHSKESLVADAGDTDVVQPSDWNAEHTLTQATAAILGRVTSGAGATEELTATQVRTLLNVEDGATADQDLSAYQLQPSEGAFVDGDKTKLDGIAAGADASPLTTKGDIYSYSTVGARLPVGTNGQVLSADSAEATGLKWIALAGGGDMAAATYDPTTVGGDAFAMDNMVEGTTTKILTDTERTKLAGIEAAADVTDTTNVTAAGALMDSEVTNLAQVKAFNSADYATAAHNHTLDSLSNTTITTIASGELLKWDGAAWINNTLAEAGIQPLATVLTNTTASFTTTLETKLNGIEALADVTDATNVTAAGALMDSEVTNLSGIKTLTVPDSTTITAAAATVLDDATVAAMVNTLGGATSTGTGGIARATSPTFATPILGTPTSGTLTNCTGLPVAGITASTSTALGVGSIELGNASDTTISRSAAGVIAVEGVPLFAGIPQNSQSAAYTLVLGDAQKHIYHPSVDTTARIWTIPANASVAFPIGTVVTFINDTSAGVITIAITTDTLVLAGAGTTGSRTLAANGMATAVKVTSTRWMISGNGLT